MQGVFGGCYWSGIAEEPGGSYGLAVSSYGCIMSRPVLGSLDGVQGVLERGFGLKMTEIALLKRLGLLLAIHIFCDNTTCHPPHASLLSPQMRPICNSESQ